MKRGRWTYEKRLRDEREGEREAKRGRKREKEEGREQTRREGKEEERKRRREFSHSVVSDSLQPHGLQHARSPCPSPTPRVYSNSCPLSR